MDFSPMIRAARRGAHRAERTSRASVYADLGLTPPFLGGLMFHPRAMICFHAGADLPQRRRQPADAQAVPDADARRAPNAAGRSTASIPYFQPLGMEIFGFGNGALHRLHETLKDAIDPNGILSPGRYDIWPRHAARDARMRTPRESTMSMLVPCLRAVSLRAGLAVPDRGVAAARRRLIEDQGSPVERGAAVFNNWCSRVPLARPARTRRARASLQDKYQGKRSGRARGPPRSHARSREGLRAQRRRDDGAVPENRGQRRRSRCTRRVSRAALGLSMISNASRASRSRVETRLSERFQTAFSAL